MENVYWKLKNWLPPAVRQSLGPRATEGFHGPGAMRDLAYRLLFNRNLCVLATVYGADKWNEHWYAQHYQAHFGPLRRKALNILEIGIAEGGSLRMWRSYFPRAQVFGIDIEDKRSLQGPRIKTYRGDQSDVQFLNKVSRDVGRLDIVIDDGSHQNEHVITTFKTLFPLLANDGLYAIEDIQTSYWPVYGGSVRERSSTQTMMGFFKSLVDGLNHAEVLGPYEASYYDRHVVAIHFYHNLIVIRKGINDEQSVRPAAEEGLLKEQPGRR